MGIFDYYFNPSSYSGNGGLLDRLLPAAQYPLQQQAAEMPLQIHPSMNPASTDISAQATPRNILQQNTSPDIGDRLLAGAYGFGAPGGLTTKLANLFSGLSTGQRSDPTGIALAQLNATYQALRAKGVPDADARAVALNPEILKTVAGNYFETKPSFGVIGQNNFGVNQYGFIQPSQMKVTPANSTAPTAPQGTGGLDPSLTGQAFLDAVTKDPQYGPGEAQKIKGIAEGKIPYPSGFIMRTPYGRWLTSAVAQYEPGVDTTILNRRRTFNQQLGSGTPSSVGGQKTLMGTSLGHLSEVADAAVALGNVDLGFAPLAHGVNYARSLTTDQAAKINKLSETVDRFSGEVGKLYSGSTGGGVHERDETRSRFGGFRSSAELAGALEASRDLILSKLQALQNQQDEIFGANSSARIDFLGKKGREALAKIEDAITRLRGGTASKSGVVDWQTYFGKK